VTSSAPGASLPVHLQVEVTAACNLRCRMCLVAYREPVDRRSGSLSVEAFEALIDQLPTVRSVTLQGLGEPLLAPDLPALVRLLAARGVATGFNTNGTLLDARHRALLLELGVDWVHVSLDAATPAVFEGIRVGASFERIVRNLRALVAERGQRRLPRLQLNAVLMRRTLGELEGLVRLAADVGVDRLWAQQLAHDLGDTAGREDFAALRAFTDGERLWGSPGDGGGGGDGVADEVADEVREVVRSAQALAAELGLDVRFPDVGEVPGGPGGGVDDEGVPHGVDELPCDWPWRSAYVNHDGRIQPCCMLMGDDRATLGHLDGPGGFLGAWHGPEYAAFRRALLSDEPPEVCRGCAQYRRRF